MRTQAILHPSPFVLVKRSFGPGPEVDSLKAVAPARAHLLEFGPDLLLQGVALQFPVGEGRAEEDPKCFRLFGHGVVQPGIGSDPERNASIQAEAVRAGIRAFTV